jgi:hypothetical protein
MSKTVVSVRRAALAVFLLVAVAGPIQAATSFSSTAAMHFVTDLKTKSFVEPPSGFAPSNTARLFSENDRDYYFHAFGCEFRLEEPIVGDDVAHYFARGLKARIGRDGLNLGGGLIGAGDYTTLLAAARPIAFGADAPPHFHCADGQTISAITIASVRLGSQKPMTLAIVFQIDGRALTAPGGQQANLEGFYAFALSKDTFSPQQEQEAWRIGGEIALALFKAYVEGK